MKAVSGKGVHGQLTLFTVAIKSGGGLNGDTHAITEEEDDILFE
jgi:hypothetical protein